MSDLDMIEELERDEKWRQEDRDQRKRVLASDPALLAQAYLRYLQAVGCRRAIVHDFLDRIEVEWQPRDRATCQRAEHALRLWLREMTAYLPYPCGCVIARNLGRDTIHTPEQDVAAKVLQREMVEAALTAAGFTIGRPKFTQCTVCYPDGNGEHREDVLCAGCDDKDALLKVFATALAGQEK